MVLSERSDPAESGIAGDLSSPPADEPSLAPKLSFSPRLGSPREPAPSSHPRPDVVHRRGDVGLTLQAPDDEFRPGLGSTSGPGREICRYSTRGVRPPPRGFRLGSELLRCPRRFAVPAESNAHRVPLTCSDSSRGNASVHAHLPERVSKGGFYGSRIAMLLLHEQLPILFGSAPRRPPALPR